MPNVSDELRKFVYKSISKKIPRAEIESALVDAHWPSDQIKNALNEYADVEFPIPIPRPRPYLSAKEAFIYLILFTALILAAINFGQLIFELIDRWLPDPADRFPNRYGDHNIQWSIAIIIITYPLFLVLNRIIQKGLRLDPSKRSSKIRKWLSYLTLFIASAFIIGDLTTLVYNVLTGDLTLRFIMKVLTVGAIAGTIFGYYLSDLRLDEKEGV